MADDTVVFQLNFDKVIEHAKNNPKPNFTHYQLLLQQFKAPPIFYGKLRSVLEQKFGLESFSSEYLAKNGLISIQQDDLFEVLKSGLDGKE